MPIAGVSTAEALLAAAATDDPAGSPSSRPVLLGPAGPSDRILTRAGETPRLVPAGTEPDLAPDERLVAIDLDGRAPDDASARGEAAFVGLGAALVALGAARLRAGGDDLAGLVPEYVTLPRGVAASDGTVSWSRDPR